MSLLIWGPMFEVGVREIDAQHRKLFDLANGLADAVIHGKGAEPLGNILTELGRYTQTHFATEELLMTKHGYPASEEHKAAHQKLIQQVADYKQRFLAGDATMAEKTLQFFTDWLSKHIMQIDKSLASDLQQKGVK